MSDRYASEYPLPGGVEHYFDSLLRFLREASKQPADAEQMKNWVLQEFAGSSGDTAINGYIGSITRMELWSTKDGIFKLTPEGSKLLELVEHDIDEAKQLLLHLKLRLFDGYDVILGQLKTGPATFSAVRERLKQALQVTWNSPNQAMFRVNWLRSLSIVTKNGREYALTAAGEQAAVQCASRDASKVDHPTREIEKSQQAKHPLELKASTIADRLNKAALQGGNWAELEDATVQAFGFLGFDVQHIGGSGNPDVIVNARMGNMSYRALVETKSRSGGVVQQNDVNLNALADHRSKANADYVLVLAAEFSGGNLETWAKQSGVRLLRIDDLRDVLLSHAQTIIPLDVLEGLFDGGGVVDDDALSRVLTASETASRAAAMARKVYEAVEAHQSKEGVLNANSLYFIFNGSYTIQEIHQAVAWLRHELVAALGLNGESLYTRVTRSALANRLAQLHLMIGATASVPP
jgi:hypothetical protein